MKELKFPLLTEEDIELRIGQMSKDGTKASLLLYQDARCGMKYLDQVVGQGNWQKKYYEVRGLVLCSLGIYDEETKSWTWKDDTGTSGSIEEEKSIISDAFKRCCVCWGLARELYTSPQIWVKVNSKYDKFRVKSISYNDKREIKSLVIADMNGEVVYSYGTPSKVSQTSQKHTLNGIERIKGYINSLPSDKKDQFSGWLFNIVNETNIDKLSQEQVDRVVNVLEKAGKI